MTPALRSMIAIGAAIGLGACAAILGIRASDARPFEHREHVLEGVNCLACHAGVDRDDDTMASHFPDARECVQCHERPHDTRDCRGCHGDAHTRERARVADAHLQFSHARHQGDCVRCHVDIADDARVLRPTMATCFGCHEHQAQWRVRDCNGCHVDVESEGEPPASHLVHDGDFVREHGARAASSRELCASCHSESACAACHGTNVAALPARMRFDRPTRSGFHAAGFASRHGEEARADQGTCAICHGERQCRDCHADRGVAAGIGLTASPHPSGWLGPRGSDNGHGRAARIDPASCATCHGGAGESLCIGCHAVGAPGGNPHPPGFSSALDVDDLPCRRCHGGGT